uniref:Membrane-associated kinase regulator 6 n=1 Tax=Rhizophora mucronata TaxID=61149 RepID=A0A2P2N2S9_RHIMU
METSQSLSIESFSYSWLVNLKPSLESLDSSFRASLDASDEASFIEMDPKMPPSKRFFRNHSHDFKFDFPISQSPLTLVHADELFSDGYVMPVFVDPSKMRSYGDSDSTSALPNSSHAPKVVGSAGKFRSSSLRRCRSLSKQVLHKYLDFLRPLYRIFRGHRTSSRTDSADTKVQVLKSWVYPAETSPRMSVAYSIDNWRKSCDSDNSIYEAVLHCKRSFGK